MNKNNQLDPGETIIIMRDGYRGKTIKGTRVFTSFHAFQDYVINNCVIDAYNQPVGTVIKAAHWSAQEHELTITQQGYMLRKINAFVASEDKDPKRLKITLEMLGLPEAKYEWIAKA